MYPITRWPTVELRLPVDQSLGHSMVRRLPILISKDPGRCGDFRQAAACCGRIMSTVRRSVVSGSEITVTLQRPHRVRTGLFVVRAVSSTPDTLADPIEHARTCSGDRVAVVDGDVTLNYAQLADRCDLLAAGLAGLGVRSGDRVALLSANGHRYLEAFFGLPVFGIVLVPLNTRLAQGELAHIVRHSGARVLITDREAGELAALVEHVVSIPDQYEALVDGGSALSSEREPE